jgi:hypothetical protein
MKIQSTAIVVAATVTFALLGGVLLNQGCGGGESPRLAAINICGAPDADLDPFNGCAFMKLCYKKKGEDKLRDCQLAAFFDAEDALSNLPYDEDISLVAECYDSDPAAAKAAPKNLLSKGQTVPFRFRPGTKKEDMEGFNVYLMQPSSFGPTLTFGNGALPCAGNETAPFSDRWGATATELFDSTVLIAGGVDDYDSGCGDWSNPDCVASAASTAELYNPRDGSFTLVGTGGTSLMTEKRAFAAAVRLPSEEVVIFGGVNAAGVATNSVDIYDPVGLSFTAGQPMLDTRARFTATLISSAEAGYILLVGGNGTGEATWEVWTPTMGTVANGQLNESRWNHTATLITKKVDAAVKRNMVVLAGGEGADGVRDTVEIFDIDANQLDPVPIALCSNGINPAAKKTMHAAAFVPKRHFLYLAGGFKDAKHAEPTKDICVWHSSQEKWSGEAGTFQLKNARGALTATALPGNVVLFAGGLTKTNGTLEVAKTVEIVFEYLNSKGETVVDIGPGDGFQIAMKNPRWDHGALLGADAKVIFFGGIASKPENFAQVKATELFNPQ